MLVLSRRRGERIRIGSQMEVTVLEIHKGRVKLGFAGPADVPVHREEVYRSLGAGVGGRPEGARCLASC